MNLFQHKNSILFSQQCTLTVYDGYNRSFEVLSPISNSNQIENFHNDLNLLLVCHKQFTNMGTKKWTKRPSWEHYGIKTPTEDRKTPSEIKHLESIFIGESDGEDENICLPIRLFAR